MNFSISIIINLINNSNHLYYENLIYDSAYNCNCSTIYNDFELEGINNYIKKNNIIKIIEFDYISDLCNFINFIKVIRELIIETIYNDNSILYCSKQYINNLDKNLYNKNNIMLLINKNKENKKYKEIYKSLY
tara:strand:+ start:1171 stop:1569 length:399 start_codon:yes stop_codon:yes gene_type:complete